MLKQTEERNGTLICPNANPTLYPAQVWRSKEIFSTPSTALATNNWVVHCLTMGLSVGLPNTCHSQRQ